MRMGIQRTYSRLKPPGSPRGTVLNVKLNEACRIKFIKFIAFSSTCNILLHYIWLLKMYRWWRHCIQYWLKERHVQKFVPSFAYCFQWSDGIFKEDRWASWGKRNCIWWTYSYTLHSWTIIEMLCTISYACIVPTGHRMSWTFTWVWKSYGKFGTAMEFSARSWDFNISSFLFYRS